MGGGRERGRKGRDKSRKEKRSPFAAINFKQVFESNVNFSFYPNICIVKSWSTGIVDTYQF